jgi:hypothetical protein
MNGGVTMPFNKDTAAAAGIKGGGNRWKNKNPETKRDKRLLVTLTAAEYATVEGKAAALNISKAELVIRAVTAYKEK